MRHHDAADQTHHVGINREQGQRDGQRDQLRQHQQLLRRNADAAQRVDFVGDHHRADLRGIGRAGAARDDDRGDQRRELAHDRQADDVDDEDVRAVAAQHRAALIRNDDAEQERQQPDDRQGVYAGVLQLVRDALPADSAGIAQRGDGRADDFADEREKIAVVTDLVDGFAADLLERSGRVHDHFLIARAAIRFDEFEQARVGRVDALE